MKIGTKSILFGAHQFVLHPLFVAWAWWRLYGFPCDLRLWIAFFVHDLGYWGKPNMDGPEGDRHVELGAFIMWFLFDWNSNELMIGKWYNLCLYHSRFYAKKNNMPFSRLCVADKLSIVLEPAWLYLPRVRWSGEIKEYMALAKSKYETMMLSTDTEKRWFFDVQEYLSRWVVEHKNGKEDAWTPCIKTTNTDSGVWK